MHCPKCQHGNTAGAAFCEQCGTRLPRQCGHCGAELSPSARFCSQCGQPATAAQPAAPRYASPEAYTPRHLADRILTSRESLEGERKQVTVLFADMKGSMELLAGRDPEEARRLLDPVLDRMMDAVHRYEGTVNQVMGDGIMALFGAPLAHEDHAVRACYAALRMQQAVKEYAAEVQRTAGVPIQIRIGLNSGEVVVRSIGSDLRMDYSAVGQTAHLAARMEQMAMGGSILLTAATLALAEEFVEVRALGPATVKGLAEPVEVFEATGAGAARRRFDASTRRGLTRFVGRSTELEQLRKSLELARQGQGQIVALVGEPGVGKTRLFHEFTHSHRTAGWTLLESGSDSHGKATPYVPLIELLRAYFHIETRDDTRRVREKVTGKLLALDRALESSLPALFALLDIPADDVAWNALDAPQRRSRTLDACKRLLVRESQVQPLILMFEDLHWIDAETQAFLDGLAASLPSARILLLVNYRPEYTPRWAGKPFFAQLRVEPLAPEQAGELLDSLLGPDPSLAPLKLLLIQRSGGNPLFGEESVRSLVEKKTLTGSRGAYRLIQPLDTIEVPATVQAILAARIDRLPAVGKRLLQEAAVIGHEVPLRVLGALTESGPDELHASLAHLQGAEFLVETSLFPETEYSFKHALTHDVAYQSLLQERRKELHGRVVEAIERVHAGRLAEHAETLARHAIRGEQSEKAVDYLRQSGIAASSRGALADVVKRYEQALELAAKLPATPANLGRGTDARLDLAQAISALGQMARATNLVEEAARSADALRDEPRQTRVAMMKGYFAWFDDRYHDALHHTDTAIALAQRIGDDDNRVRAEVIRAMSQGLLGDWRAAIATSRSSTEGADVEIAQRLTSALSASLYVAACSWRGLWHAYGGEFQQADEYAARAAAFAGRLGVARARAVAIVYRAWGLGSKGEFTSAIPLLEEGLERARKEGLVYWVSISSIFLGAALAEAGRPREGLVLTESGLALQEQMGTRVGRSVFQAFNARTLLRAGELGRAQAMARQALERAIASGEVDSEAFAGLVLAQIATEAGEPEAASLFERALQRYRALDMRPGIAMATVELARWRRRSGDARGAAQALAEALPAARELGMNAFVLQVKEEFGLEGAAGAQGIVAGTPIASFGTAE